MPPKFKKQFKYVPSWSRPGELPSFYGADEKEEDAKCTFMHDDDVLSVACSPDGTHFVSGSWNKSVRI